MNDNDLIELAALRHFVERTHNLHWNGIDLVPIVAPVPQPGDHDYLKTQHHDLWEKLRRHNDHKLLRAIRKVHLDMSSAAPIDGFDEHWIAELADGRFVHIRSVFLDLTQLRVSYYANKETLIAKADLIVLGELTCDKGWEAVSEREQKEWA
jgi:hypothetical protein